ncbi:hypothetical protein [Aureimonas glaciei]|uniref:Uncharacterized protein n=1 Tax=Aureimonas glaciei TaxID=1776957 RepID=A0A916Y048_9HYPH|nr:hypothetical protein [Aureimonas glaciei]GGD24456.1 hypothetical protein GCM10011335_29210 [Aureimonas glaciei]
MNSAVDTIRDLKQRERTLMIECRSCSSEAPANLFELIKDERGDVPLTNANYESLKAPCPTCGSVNVHYSQSRANLVRNEPVPAWVERISR